MLSEGASTWLFIAGFALAIYVLLRRRRVSEVAPPRRPFTSLRSLAAENEEAERPLELLRCQVEMHETATRLKAELDSKLSALQALVIMAQRESARLEAAIRRAETLDRRAPSDSLAVLERLGEPAALQNPHAIRSAAEALPDTTSARFPDPFQDEQTELAIANLAAQGLPAADIARRLNLPLGEVEIRLNMVAR